MIHLGLKLSRPAPATGPSAPSDSPDSSGEAAFESKMIAVLDRAVPGETIATSYGRRERELRALFEWLTPAECRELADRLEARAPGDRLAERFARLVPERRHRLISFLRDARRREAVRSARP